MAKRKMKKTKLSTMTLITMLCAVLMIVSCFMTFVTYKTESIIGNNDDNVTGLDLMENDFPSDMDNEQLAFGLFTLQLGAWSSIIGGGALLLVLVVALLLPKMKVLISVSKLLSLVTAILSVLCLIGGIIVSNQTAVSIGTLFSYKLVMNIGIFMYLAGGVGSLVSSVMTK